MSRCVEADDLTKLEYAVTHHTQSNPPTQYQVTDLIDVEHLKTGIYAVAPSAKGLPEDFSGQVFGSMIVVMKFSIETAFYFLMNYNWTQLYWGTCQQQVMRWMKLAFQE